MGKDRPTHLPFLQFGTRFNQAVGGRLDSPKEGRTLGPTSVFLSEAWVREGGVASAGQGRVRGESDGVRMLKESEDEA